MSRLPKLSVGRSLLFCAFTLIAESCHRRQPVIQKAKIDWIRADQEKLNLATAETLFQHGLRFEFEGQYESAIDAFTKAIALVNDHYPSWLHRGRVDMLQGKPSAALMYLEAAVSLRPDDPQALHWRGDALLPLGEPAKAIADYSRALQFETDMLERAAIYVSRGEAYLQSSQENKALEDYTKAISWRPGAPTPYYRRGLLLERLGRLQEAVRDFTLAGALGQNYVEAKVALDRANGQLARLTSDTPPPVQQVASIPNRPAIPPEPPTATMSTPLLPQPAEPKPSPPPEQTPLPAPHPATADSIIPTRTAQDLWRSGLRSIYARQEAKGIDELNEAIRLKPDFAQAFNARGFAWLLLREYPKAIADFDAALRISPNYANALHNRSVAVTESTRKPGRKIASATSAAPAIAGDSTAESRWRSARELIQVGQYDSAVRQLDGAIALKPTYAQAYNARGYAWLLLRDYQRAIADFDQALRLLPNYVNANQNREMALRAARRTHSN